MNLLDAPLAAAQDVWALLAFALEVTLKASLLVLTSLAVSAALRRRASAAARHVLWSLTACGLLLLPFLAWMTPTIAIPLLPAAVEPQPTAVEASNPQPRNLPGAPDAAGPAAASSSPKQTEGAAFAWRIALPLAYLLGWLMLTASLATGIFRLRRLRLEARRADQDALWSPLMSELAKSNPRVERTALLESREAEAPMTWGILRPRILMPERAARWSQAERRSALTHELAHVVRGDWALLVLARAAVALHWFNPLAWIAFRRLALEAERACDDRVLRLGARPSSYAKLLLQITRQMHPGGLPMASASMGRPKHMTRRIESILNPLSRRSPMRFRSVASAALFSLALLSLLAAGRITTAESASAEAKPLPAASASAPAAMEPRPQQRRGLPLVRRVGGPAMPALFRAAREGDSAEVARLLDAGADPNQIVAGSRSALIHAALHGRLEVVRLLLDRGADPNLYDDARRSKGSSTWPRTPLGAAARFGDPVIVATLLEAGADVNGLARGDGTALMEAAGQGHIESMRLLIHSRAEVNRRVIGDGTALIIASREGRAQAVRLLLDSEADPDLAVEGDGNPLIMAAREGHLDIAKMLLEAGADPLRYVPGDENPTVAASENGHQEILDLLRAYTARR